MMQEKMTAEEFQVRFNQNAIQRPPRRFIAKKGKRAVGGRTISFNSKSEANYARYLEHLKTQKLIHDWEYEPQTFWFHAIKRGVVSYLPDFKVTHLSGNVVWVEVKGFMDSKSKTKIKRFEKYYPDEILTVVGADWFKANSQLSRVIAGWE